MSRAESLQVIHGRQPKTLVLLLLSSILLIQDQRCVQSRQAVASSSELDLLGAHEAMQARELNRTNRHVSKLAILESEVAPNRATSRRHQQVSAHSADPLAASASLQAQAIDVSKNATSARQLVHPNPLASVINQPSATSLSSVRQKWRLMEQSLGSSFVQTSVELRRTIEQLLASKQDGRPLPVSAQCRASLNEFLFALSDQEMWASQMLDASARRLPNGLLEGTLTELGHFDECLAVNNQRATFGQYCSVQIKPALINRPRLHTICRRLPSLASSGSSSNSTSQVMRFLSQISHQFLYVGLRLGLCVPNKCKLADVQLLLSAYLQPFELTGEVKRCEQQQRLSHELRSDPKSTSALALYFQQAYNSSSILHKFDLVQQCILLAFCTLFLLIALGTWLDTSHKRPPSSAVKCAVQNDLTSSSSAVATATPKRWQEYKVCPSTSGSSASCSEHCAQPGQASSNLIQLPEGRLYRADNGERQSELPHVKATPLSLGLQRNPIAELIVISTPPSTIHSSSSPHSSTSSPCMLDNHELDRIAPGTQRESSCIFVRNNISKTENQERSLSKDPCSPGVPPHEKLNGSARSSAPSGLPGWWARLLICFSLANNLRAIGKMSASKLNGEAFGAADIRVIHGLRTLSMVWIIFGHTIGLVGPEMMKTFTLTIVWLLPPRWTKQTISSTACANDPDKSDTLIPLAQLSCSSRLLQALLNATLAVDTFFMISGLVTVISFLRKCSSAALLMKGNSKSNDESSRNDDLLISRRESATNRTSNNGQSGGDEPHRHRVNRSDQSSPTSVIDLDEISSVDSASSAVTSFSSPASLKRCISSATATTSLADKKSGKDKRTRHTLARVPQADTWWPNDFKPLVWLLMRYLRLTPAYASIIGVSILMPALGSGPFWAETVGQMGPACRANWWTNLIYLNNFVETDKLCLIHSWYLSNDWQFFLLTLVLFGLFYKSKKLTLLLVVCLILGSSAATLISTIENEFPPTIVTTSPAVAERWQFIHQLYYKPWPHLPPYLVGIITGYLILQQQISQKQQVSKGGRLFCWFLFALIGLAVLNSIYPWNMGIQVDPLITGLHSSTFRTLWAASCAWLVYALVTRPRNPLALFLGWQGFQVTSRLTYCAYLVHPLVIYYHFGSLRERIDSSPYGQLHRFMATLVLSYLLAFLLSILIESPSIQLQRFLAQLNSNCSADRGRTSGNGQPMRKPNDNTDQMKRNNNLDQYWAIDSANENIECTSSQISRTPLQAPQSKSEIPPPVVMLRRHLCEHLMESTDDNNIHHAKRSCNLHPMDKNRCSSQSSSHSASVIDVEFQKKLAQAIGRGFKIRTKIVNGPTEGEGPLILDQEAHRPSSNKRPATQQASESKSTSNEPSKGNSTNESQNRSEARLSQSQHAAKPFLVSRRSNDQLSTFMTRPAQPYIRPTSRKTVESNLEHPPECCVSSAISQKTTTSILRNDGDLTELMQLKQKLLSKPHDPVKSVA